jgi:hypothetical protein
MMKIQYLLTQFKANDLILAEGPEVLITTHMIYYYENSFNLANSGKVS